MSTFCKHFQVVLAVLLIVLPCTVTQARELYWEPSGSGIPNGGDGEWNTTDLFWSTDAVGTSYVAWNNASNDTAVFYSASWTEFVVTLGEGITASNIYKTAYISPMLTITNETLTLTGGNIDFSSVSTPGDSGGAASITIYSTIAGTNGITMSGAHGANLYLAGSNTFSGQLVVSTATGYKNLYVRNSHALGASSTNNSNGTYLDDVQNLYFDGVAGNLTVQEYIEVDYNAFIKNTGGDNVITGVVERRGSVHLGGFDIDAGSLTVNGKLIATQDSSVQRFNFLGPNLFTLNGDMETDTAAPLFDFEEGGSAQLILNGSANSASAPCQNLYPLDLESGDLLGGSATLYVGDDQRNFRLYGTLSPGPEDAIGTIEFHHGNLWFTNTTVFDFDLSSTPALGLAAADVNDLIIQSNGLYNGEIVLDGTLNIDAIDGNLGQGTYTLIEYDESGTWSCPHTTQGSVLDRGLELGTVPSGYTFTITNDSSNGRIDLIVVQPQGTVLNFR